MGATIPLQVKLADPPVSIHAPVWVRLKFDVNELTQRQFQFTHPCGCDCLNAPGRVNNRGFNSRTRVGATFFVHRYYLTPAVSIHAPVWVRPVRGQGISLTPTFQFTHPCGCDCLFHRQPRRKCCFNSRTRVGATKGGFNVPGQDIVSIHAPVWVRHQIAVHTGIFVRFQFTHPCGCDLVRHPIATMQRVSIHAPVWVRHPIAAPIGFFVKFQFTHPCGCDFVFFWILLVSFGFNSRTRVGATA